MRNLLAVEVQVAELHRPASELDTKQPDHFLKPRLCTPGWLLWTLHMELCMHLPMTLGQSGSMLRENIFANACEAVLLTLYCTRVLISETVLVTPYCMQVN